MEISIRTANTTLLFITSINIFILSPIQFYYAYLFWQYKNQNIAFFTKRHPSLILFNILVFNSYPTIIRPFIDYLRINNLISHHHPFTIFCLNVTQMFAVILTMRLFLLYYDYNHSLHSVSMRWTSHIKQNTENTFPWTIKYKWASNIKFLSIIAFSLSATLMLFVIVGCTLFPRYITFIQILGFIYFGIMLAITFKIRTCRDHLSIQKEYITNAILLIFSLCLYLIATMLFHDTTSNIRVIATNLSSDCMCYGFTSISTIWTVHRYRKEELQKNEFNRKQSVSRIELTLEEILSCKDGWDIFIDHLCKEFSVENMFFIFEVMQIKYEAIFNQLIDAEDIGVFVKINEDLLKNLRIAEINITNIETFKDSLKYTMGQYVVYDAEFCVNISAITRSKILGDYSKMFQQTSRSSPLKDEVSASICLSENVNRGDVMHVEDLKYFDYLETTNTTKMPKKALKLLKDESMIEYIKVFDTGIEEIVHLMEKDSLLRFYLTEEYKILVQNMKQ